MANVRVRNGLVQEVRDKGDFPERSYGVTGHPAWADTAPETTTETSAESSAPAETDTYYLKITFILTGTLVLVIVLFGLVRAIVGSDVEPITQTTTIEVAPTDPVSTTEFTITARGGSSACRGASGG